MWPLFFLEQLERGKVALSLARISVEHKTCGSCEGDSTNDHLEVFSVKSTVEGTKVWSIFLKDMTRNLVECTFSCLTDILFRTSLWTINNYSLGRRWIEAEYSRWGKYSKIHYSLRLKSILTKSLRKPFKFNLIGKSVNSTCAEPPIKLQFKKPPANKAFWFIWNRQKFKLCFPAWEAK